MQLSPGPLGHVRACARADAPDQLALRRETVEAAPDLRALLRAARRTALEPLLERMPESARAQGTAHGRRRDLPDATAPCSSSIPGVPSAHRCPAAGHEYDRRASRPGLGPLSASLARASAPRTSPRSPFSVSDAAARPSGPCELLDAVRRGYAGLPQPRQRARAQPAVLLHLSRIHLDHQLSRGGLAAAGGRACCRRHCRGEWTPWPTRPPT